MTQESVIYTDGHGVKVTPNQLIINNAEYFLDGLTDIKLFTIRANKAPGILLMLVGLAAVILSFMGLFTRLNLNNISLGGLLLSADKAALIFGVILIFTGLLWTAVVHDKYAVRIRTAEGEKDALTSRKRDYIVQIVDAVNKATLV